MNFETIISTVNLARHLKDDRWVIIDCRHSLDDVNWGRNEYIESHIPGAYFAHLDEDLSGDIIPGKTGRHPLPKDMSAFADLLGSWDIDDSTQVVVYDQSHGGVASRLWWMLQYVGHSRVAVLDGGWQKWLKENRMVSTQIQPLAKGSFLPGIQSQMVGDMQYVRACMSDDKKQIIDSRAAARHAGLEEPIDPVAGHIPTSENYPFLENVDENHCWKPKEELKDRFASLFDHHSSENIIVHCGSGVTACHNLLAMKHAGYPMPKLYPGSWSEWITDLDNPVGASGTCK